MPIQGQAMNRDPVHTLIYSSSSSKLTFPALTKEI